MEIKTLGSIIQLKIEEAKAGVLDTSSRSTAVEFAEVIGKGEEVKLKVEIGDKVFVKAWAIDIINHEDKKYYFVDETTGGILATVK